MTSGTDAAEGSDGSTPDAGTPALPGTDRRSSVVRIGLGLTAALAGLMLLFVLADWLQTLGGPAGDLGVALSDRYLGVGAALDRLVGTNVFAHRFMLRAVATGVLVGVAGPLIGTFLVHRQMALIGETLAHTAFAGVAVGMVIAGLTGMTGTRDELLLVAFVVSALAALGLQWLTAYTDSYGDVPIAIVLTGSFAVGTLLISAFRDRVAIGVEVEDFLFGELSVVTPEGMRMVGILTLAVVGLVAWNYKQLLFITFDEQAARVARLNVRWYNSLLVVMTAVIVVGAMQILGVILVAGLLVIPPAGASLLGRSFRETLSLSILFGEFSVLLGLFVSIVGSLPAGGSIIVVAIAVYVGAVAVSDRTVGRISLQ